MWALWGSHRTGKSSLAKAAAKEMNIPFVRSDVSGVLDSLGLDASKQMDFVTRMKAQHAILDAHIGLWKKHRLFVTDRCPLDFLMYTVADIDQSGDWDDSVIQDYADRCYDLTNMYFTELILVQPGIPLVVDKKNTGVMDKSFIFKLNVIAKGLMWDERLQVNSCQIREGLLDFNKRLETVCEVFNESLDPINNEREAVQAVLH